MPTKRDFIDALRLELGHNSPSPRPLWRERLGKYRYDELRHFYYLKRKEKRLGFVGVDLKTIVRGNKIVRV